LVFAHVCEILSDGFRRLVIPTRLRLFAHGLVRSAQESEHRGLVRRVRMFGQKILDAFGRFTRSFSSEGLLCPFEIGRFRFGLCVRGHSSHGDGHDSGKKQSAHKLRSEGDTV
jgi:hypothetical protein